jgi:hypothetical protein
MLSASAGPPLASQVRSLQEGLALVGGGSPLLALPAAAETLSEALGVDLVA